MPFKQFDRSKLKLKPLSEREHDLDLSVMMYPEDELAQFSHDGIKAIAAKTLQAKKKGAAVIMMMGGHVIRAGAAPLLIEMMKRGWITHFAMNGAGAIHDFEFAKIRSVINPKKLDKSSLSKLIASSVLSINTKAFD